MDIHNGLFAFCVEYCAVFLKKGDWELFSVQRLSFYCMGILYTYTHFCMYGFKRYMECTIMKINTTRGGLETIAM